MKKKVRFFTSLLFIMVIILFCTDSCKKEDDKTNKTPATVTDIDGNIYHTITIGTQVWMLENLKVIKYRNGDPIPNITDTTQWGNQTTGAYCYYENDKNNANTYGALYNWYAVNDPRNIAPVGWHVPTDTEWTTLTSFLGADSVVGGKLKEAGTAHWHVPNTGATNSSGFTALPAGFRFYEGSFYGIGKECYWWTATEGVTGSAYHRYLHYFLSSISRANCSSRPDGFSVRCIMD